METFTFYSYKGGSGRSLLLTNAARYLASLGKRVVAIDFDFEAPGLHYKMHIGRSGVRTGDVLPERGVVDYLLATTRGQSASPKLADYVTPVALPRGTKGQLLLMPAGAAPSGAYWKSLTELLQRRFFSDHEGAGIAACLELKARIEDELKADFILIDSRTGITELAGLATALLADKVICLVINNRESLAGARAVMRSFGRVPRLNRQGPIDLVAVLSRVPDANRDTRREVLDFLNEPGPTEAETLDLKHLYVLRVDPDLAKEEKLHVGVGSISRSLLYQDYLELFNALVKADTELVSAAAQRHEAIVQMKEWLTDGFDSQHHRHSVPDPFDEAQIDEGVTLGNYEKRYADIVAYSGSERSEPLLAAEYVEDVKSSDAWQWWEKNTNLRCAILFSKTPRNPLLRRVFTRGKRNAKFIAREDFEGWIVKWPVSFTALDDPGDRSVDAMVKAVQRGEDSFIGLLVTEWQHSSFVTLHGGAPFRPSRARKILDGLAQVKDLETELRVLWRTAPDPFERDLERFGPDGGSLAEQMTRELHAPLFWRLSIEAKIEFLGGRNRRHREGPALAGLEMLSRDLMGLWLDEDRNFREEVQQLIGSDYAHGDDEVPAYRFSSLFQDRELKFEFSSDPPPELVRRAALDYLLSDPDDQRSESIWLHARRIGTKALSDYRLLSRLIRASGRRFHPANLLGSYDPTSCRVTIYPKLIHWMAQALDSEARPLANVIFLRETVKAICHLGRDLDGGMWNDFGQAATEDINYRPNLLLETMAQYFSWNLLQRLQDSSMIGAFDQLSECQPDEYQIWNRLRDVSIEEMRRILLRARGGLDDLSLIYRLRQ